MGALYKLTFENGKSYIGITSKTLKRRLSLHLSQARNGRTGALQNAIRKYGESSFSSEVLLNSDDWDFLCKKEIEAISIYGTLFPLGYNLTCGGDGLLGVKASKETRERLSAAKKGKGIGNEYALGYRHTDEAKLKISEAGKGRIFSQESRLKLSASKVGNKFNVGRITSDETKKKISDAQKGRPLSEKHRQAMNGCKKGKPWSEARRLAHENKKKE